MADSANPANSARRSGFRSGRGFTLALVAAIALSGCGTLRSAQRSLTGEPEGEPVYAATADVPVRSTNFATSKVVGRLALHEKVIRTGVDRGFAHVVTASGLEGWVDNAQLIWRLPAAKPPAQREAPRTSD